MAPVMILLVKHWQLYPELWVRGPWWPGCRASLLLWKFLVFVDQLRDGFQRHVPAKPLSSTRCYEAVVCTETHYEISSEVRSFPVFRQCHASGKGKMRRIRVLQCCVYLHSLHFVIQPVYITANNTFRNCNCDWSSYPSGLPVVIFLFLPRSSSMLFLEPKQDFVILTYHKFHNAMEIRDWLRREPFIKGLVWVGVPLQHVKPCCHSTGLMGSMTWVLGVAKFHAFN